METQVESDTQDDAGLPIRKRTEETALAQKPGLAGAQIPAQLDQEQERRISDELQTSQIEVEMLKEELGLAQERLEAMRSKYFSFYNLAPVGYLTISADGLVTEVNSMAEYLLGASAQFPLNEPFARLIAREDQDIFRMFYKEIFETGMPQTCELRMARLDGAQFWARLDATAAEDAEGGQETHIVVADITERKRDEDRLRAIFEQAGVGVAIVESATGRFLHVNHKYAEIVGLTAEELLASSFDRITHPDDLQIDWASMEKLKKGLISEYTMDKRYIHKNGSIVWVALTVSPLWHEGPDLRQHLAIVHDVTGRKLVEEELRLAKEKALACHF